MNLRMEGSSKNGYQNGQRSGLRTVQMLYQSHAGDVIAGAEAAKNKNGGKTLW